MSSALSSCDMSWNTIACPPESTRSYHLASVSTGVSELSAMCRVLVTVLDDITKSKNTCVCKAAPGWSWAGRRCARRRRVDVFEHD